MTKLLSLHNFKAFRNCSLELRPLTVLAGVNGSGKSSTLQALALLRQSHDAGFLGERGLLLNGDLVELGTGSDVLHDQHEDDEISISLRDEADGIELEFSSSYEASADVLRRIRAPSADLIMQSKISRLFGNCFQYLRADRFGPAVSYPKSHHVVSDRRFLGAQGEFTAHYLHLFRDDVVAESSRRHPDSSATPGLLSQVNAWLHQLSPGARIDVEEVHRTDFVRLSYAYGGSAGISGSNLFRPTNVGFGLTYALPVIVACLASPSDSWVMIENPEAHLHPQGQALMGNLLARAASTGVQVMVETHSDHLLNGIRLAVKDKLIAHDAVALHFFRRGADESQPTHHQPKVSPAGRLSNWPDGFFDEWDKALDRLLG